MARISVFSEKSLTIVSSTLSRGCVADLCFSEVDLIFDHASVDEVVKKIGETTSLQKDCFAYFVSRLRIAQHFLYSIMFSVEGALLKDDNARC